MLVKVDDMFSMAKDGLCASIETRLPIAGSMFCDDYDAVSSFGS